MNNDKTDFLSAEDLNKLVEENAYKKNKTINFLGLTLDFDSTVVYSISILLWTILWYIFDFWKYSKHSKAIFIFFIVYQVINAYNSATTTADVSISAQLFNEAANYIQSYLSILVITIVFLFNINIKEDKLNVIYKFLIIALVLITPTILDIGSKNTARALRIGRKIKYSLYNQSMTLYMFAMILIYENLR